MKQIRKNNKAKKITQVDSFSSQQIKYTRRKFVVVNLFLMVNILLVPTLFIASNVRNQNIDAQVSGQLFSQGYENGFTGWGGSNQGQVGTYQKNTSTAQVREGSYSGRFELRDGDCPLTGNCATDYGERSEVQGSTSSTGGYEGDVRWYKWSTRFASPFATNSGFQTFSQWHDNGPGSPPIAFYAEGGKIRLVANYNTGQTDANGNPIIYYGNVMWSANLQTDKWYDIKMRILWSGDDTKGQVSLWIDGSAVTLTKSTSRITSCSGNTCTLRTLRPGSSSYYKQGLYRSVNYTANSVIYHDGFVAATTEAGLGGSTSTPPTGGGTSTGGGTTTTPSTGGSTTNTTTNSSSSTQTSNGGNDTGTVTPIQPVFDVSTQKDKETGEIKLSESIPINSHGEYIADFNGDGQFDTARDLDGNGYVNPESELISNGDNSSYPTIGDSKSNDSSRVLAKVNFGPLGVIEITKKGLKSFYLVQIIVVLVLFVIIVINARNHFINRLLSH